MMRLRLAVLVSLGLGCLLGLVFPHAGQAQFVVHIRSPHPQIDPAIHALAQACSSQLNAAAAVGNSGDLNVDLSNVAVAMITGRRDSLNREIQDTQRYIAAVGPGGLQTMSLAHLCIRQAAVDGAGSGAAPASAGQGATDLTGEWVGQSSGNRVAITMRSGGIEVAPVTQNAGQTATGMLYREVAPGSYRLASPDGSFSVAEVQGGGVLRVTNSTGWTDLFRRTSRPAAASPLQRTSPAWYVGRWRGESRPCADETEFRADGTFVSRTGFTGQWWITDGRLFLEGNGARVEVGIERIGDDRVRLTDANDARVVTRCGPADIVPSPTTRDQPPAVAQSRLPATATVRLRLAGYYGTRCVTPSLRNVRRPQEANPHPTSWVGDWTLTNNCPVAQWVRIEVDGAGHIFWSGLQTPGARMQPSPNLVPSLPFQPIREHDFQFGWLVPASSDLVTGTAPVLQGAVDNGLDVWIASCDAVGDARRQAIYLSAPFRSSPRTACYNHALPNGGNDAR